MPIPLRQIPFPDHERKTPPVPGDVYEIALAHKYANGTSYGEMTASRLSDEFRASGRTACIVVVCPDGTHWNCDLRASNGIGGWTITGALPNITAHPSINVEGSYHGWLIDGVLSDDLEKRTY